MFLMLQQSTPTSSHTNKTCNNNDKVVIDPLSISTATTAADKNDDSSSTPVTMLSSDSRNELLMGYDLLSNIFTAQSNLWLVPILRKLSPGSTPLVSETTDLIQRLVKSGSKHKKELATNILIKNGESMVTENLHIYLIKTLLILYLVAFYKLSSSTELTITIFKLPL